MNVRKHMLLVVGGGLALVGLVAAVVMLLRYQGRYAEVVSQLESRKARLEQLNQRDPFPSQENVDLATRNLDKLKGFYDGLLATISRGQVTVQEMEKAGFRQLLDTTLSQLTKQGKNGNVAMPLQFAFGFDRYQKGAQPDPQHIFRLVVQLKTVEALCKILYQAKIVELISINRENFDEAGLVDATAAQMLNRRGMRGVVAPGPEPAAAPADGGEAGDGLVSRELITLTFLTRESALWSIMNTLAGSATLCEVKELELTNERKAATVEGATRSMVAARPAEPAGSGLGEAPGSAAGLEAAPPPPSRQDERIVAGDERIKVTLKLAVYRFNQTPKAAGASS